VLFQKIHLQSQFIAMKFEFKKFGFIKHIFELASITVSKEKLDELKNSGVCKLQLSEYATSIRDILAKAGVTFSNLIMKKLIRLNYLINGRRLAGYGHLRYGNCCQ
jgi:hypothetical protein